MQYIIFLCVKPVQTISSILTESLDWFPIPIANEVTCVVSVAEITEEAEVSDLLPKIKNNTLLDTYADLRRTEANPRSPDRGFKSPPVADF